MSVFKLYRFGFICTFFMLLFSFLVSEKFQDVIGMILVLCIGILHGTNDLKIIQKFGKTKQKKTFAYFILYVGVVFFGGLLFYNYPQAALPLFVLVSAFHFGVAVFHCCFCHLQGILETVLTDIISRQCAQEKNTLNAGFLKSLGE